MAKISKLTDDMKHCLVCGSPYIQVHHVLYGSGNRKISDAMGYIVPLCMAHHTGDNGVHHNKPLDLHFKRMAQKHFEENVGSRENFIRTFGRSYID